MWCVFGGCVLYTFSQIVVWMVNFCISLFISLLTTYIFEVIFLYFAWNSVSCQIAYSANIWKIKRIAVRDYNSLIENKFGQKNYLDANNLMITWLTDFMKNCISLCIFNEVCYIFLSMKISLWMDYKSKAKLESWNTTAICCHGTVSQDKC